MQVFQKGSLLTRDFSRTITLLQEGDDTRHIDNKWFSKKASCSNPHNAGSSNSVTLSRDSFWGLFLIAGFASSLALLIFAAMFLYEHRYTWICHDPGISFSRIVRVILRAYDQKDTSSKICKGSRLQEQDSVQSISCDSNDIESQVVLEELGTPSTDTEHGDLYPNSQETQGD
ncbi:hypothetical protein ACLB2K_050826 [Fragaria x ananassa]